MKKIFALAAAYVALFALVPGVSFAAGLSISSISATTVNPGTEVYFTVTPSGFAGNPSYSVADSISNSTANSGDINSAGTFVWIPSAGDAGTHTITISATDSSGDTANISETITVNGTPTLTIGAVSPSASVNAGTPVFFSASVTGFRSAPTFSVSDSVTGSTILNSNVNSAGGFSWTPSTTNSYDQGSHTITVVATDSSGDTASASTGITVAAPTSVAISNLSPGQNVSSGQNVSFTATATGFTSPTFSVFDSSASGSTVSIIDLNSSTGAFSWTPTQGDAGTHNITISAKDSLGHNASATQTIYVNVNNIATTTSASATTTSSAASSNTASLQSQIAALTAQLNLLLGQVNGISANTAATAPAQASVSASYTFGHYLSPGSKGADVTALQNILINQGFLHISAATGYYGGLTVAAVEAYQSAHGIDSLGVVGPATRAYLNSHQ